MLELSMSEPWQRGTVASSVCSVAHSTTLYIGIISVHEASGGMCAGLLAVLFFQSLLMSLCPVSFEPLP